MANPFQSTPSYNSPYGGSAPYYPQYQQYGGHPQQPAHSPASYSPHAMPPMGGYQPSPNTNMGRFDTNSHSHSQMPPSQRFPFPPPAPFPADMLKQFANSSVPLPPPPGFPPVPIPNLGMQQFSHTFPLTTTPPFPSSANGSHSEDPDAYDPRYPQSMMSSRQPEKPAYGSNHMYSQPLQQQRQGQEEDDSPPSRTISHEDQHLQSTGNQADFTHPPNIDGATFSSQQKVPILPVAETASSQLHPPMASGALQPIEVQAEASPTPPKPPPPNAAPSYQSVNPFQPQHDVQSQVQSANNSKPFQRHYENKTVAEMRQLAKGALLSLAPHSIHYQDLVKEGIDSHTLQVLYEELGIKISAVKATEQSNTLAPPHSQPTETSVPSAAAPLSVPAPINSSLEALDRPAPAVSPSLERKDRIAQLLAAKAGRPTTPARSVSDSVGSAGALEPPQIQPPASDRATKSTAHLQAGVGADPQQVASTSPSLAQAETLKNSLERLRDEPIVKIPLERRSTDGGPVPSPFSSSIPGLFMTTDDRMQFESAQASAAVASLTKGLRTTSTSQKRRRSSDAEDQEYQPDPKRQNTTSELDEGEVMAIDSPSNDDASEGEIADDEPLPRQTQDVGVYRGSQLQRSQSATELPTVVPSGPQAGDGLTNGPTPHSLSRPFGNTAVTGMTAAQISERAEMLKARFLKQRAARQQALQDGLPNLDAEVNKTQALLAERRNALQQVEDQIRNLNADIALAEKRKQETIEEISQLERQLQEGISGQRKYNDELRKLSTEQSIPANAPKSNTIADAPSVEAAIASATPVSLPAEPVHNRPITSASSEEGVSVSDADLMQDTDQSPMLSFSDNNTREGSMSREQVASDLVVAGVGVASNHHIDGSQTRLETAVQHDTDTGIPGLETFVGTGTELTVEPSLASGPESKDSMEDVGIDGEDSDGSASMSGSEGTEDEYEPADPGSTYPMELDDNASQEYDPEAAPVNPTPPSAQIQDPEDYEPAEDIIETVAADEAQQSDDMALEGPGNIKEPLLSNGSQSQIFHQPSPTSQLDGSSHNFPAGGPSRAFKQRSVSTLGEVRPLSNEGSGPKIDFAPYQSPLSSLKSYRYNEQFNESAKEGFRSLTYSNTIDPNVPLCQTELAGSVCQDPSCQEQHFRKFQLTDDQILVQMSSSSDIPDKETRDSYTKGLKELIGDLRSRNIKEFENVANELSNYRRRFFAAKEAT